MTALKDYLTITQAAIELKASRQRVHQLVADLQPPDRLDVHARLTLISRRAVDRLRNRKPGRPVGWRKKKERAQ
jgi:hypothetical protein